MASRTRPLLMTGAALASAAAIVTASPALLPTHDIAVGAPSPLPLSNAQYELTAITDITLQGISDAYYFGWGGNIGCGDLDADGNCTNTPPDPYFPGVANTYASGAPGVLYYLLDETIRDIVPGFDINGAKTTLYDYYFQIGAAYPNGSTGGYSGLPAVLYVGASEFLGPEAGAAVALLQTFPYQITQAIVGAASNLPTFAIGPVVVGGGILAGLYFNGVTPDGSFNYGTPGLSAIGAYLSTAITGALSPSAAAAAAKTAAATTLSASDTTTDSASGTGALETAKGGAAHSKVSAPSTAAGETATDTTDSDASTGDGTAPAGSSTDGSATGGSTSTDGDTPVTPKSTGGTTSKPSTAKPAKPQNPLAKIGKRISDALSGKKAKSGSSSSSSSDSDSSGSSDSAS